MKPLPKALTLPSGLRVTLGIDPSKSAATASTALFADAIALFDGALQVEIRDLPLGDFHVLRAVATKHGLLDEEEVEIDCMNCSELIRVRPCAALETGPWEDGELDDPELDRTAELGAALAIEPVLLGRVRTASTVTFAPRTVREALPLFTALGKNALDLDVKLVSAMGIVALGPLREPDRIARALATCDDDGFDSITDAWLDAHYVPRLASDVTCTKCNARNTVDAPYLREFERGSRSFDGGARALPSLDDFVELAHEIGDPLLEETPEPPELLVEDGTPAVDDGGVPLLGSYVPPPPKDAPVPSGPGTVTVYYRTFVAMAEDEPGWDWRGELRETIEHELEHHVAFLRGHDPMDEEEHAEIDRDAVRIVGRSEAQRRALGGFGASVADFFRRAWPLVLIGGVVLAITIAEARC